MQVNLKGFLRDKRKFSTGASSVNWWHKENVRWNLEGRTKGIHYDKRRFLSIVTTHEDPEQADSSVPDLLTMLDIKEQDRIEQERKDQREQRQKDLYNTIREAKEEIARIHVQIDEESGDFFYQERAEARNREEKLYSWYRDETKMHVWTAEEVAWEEIFGRY